MGEARREKRAVGIAHDQAALGMGVEPQGDAVAVDQRDIAAGKLGVPGADWAAC